MKYLGIIFGITIILSCRSNPVTNNVHIINNLLNQIGDNIFEGINK